MTARGAPGHDRPSVTGLSRGFVSPAQVVWVDGFEIPVGSGDQLVTRNGRVGYSAHARPPPSSTYRSMASAYTSALSITAAQRLSSSSLWVTKPMCPEAGGQRVRHHADDECEQCPTGDRAGASRLTPTVEGRGRDGLSTATSGSRVPGPRSVPQLKHVPRHPQRSW